MSSGTENITICIPTENRYQMVGEVLEKALEYYPRYGLQVIYFDTSSDDSTEKLVSKYQKKGFERLQYVRIDRSNSLDQKLFDLLRTRQEIRNSKYVWLINDSISINDRFLSDLNEKLNEDYDLIRLVPPGFGFKEDKVFTSQNEWFHQSSAGMAHMASTIMKTSLLDYADWDDLYKKYIVNDKVGMKDHGYFFTVGMYLELILKQPDFKGLLVNNRIQWRHDCRSKQGISYWNDIIFEVWAKSYCDTIFKLPDVYTDKAEVIRSSDNIIFGRFERRSLEQLRDKQLFNSDVVKEYADYWQYVSTLNISEIEKIAKENVGNSYKFDQDDWEGRLEEMEKTVCNRPIVLYGAGMQCEYTIEKLISDGFDQLIQGVAVTDTNSNVEEVKGYLVRCIDEYESLKENAIILIATKPVAADEIELSLKEKGYKNIFKLM